MHVGNDNYVVSEINVVWEMDSNNVSSKSAEDICDSTAGGEQNNDNINPAGGLDEVQMYLTCLPERYMRAKFALSAYILCWAVLKLCQVRGSLIT